MKGYDYSYTDRVLNYLSKKFITLFNRIRNLASFDELNILGASNELYRQLRELIDRNFLLIAKRVAEQVGGDGDDIATDWLLDFLEEYDPITGYVFDHEVDRKKAYFQESLIATENRNQSIKKALSYFDRMVRQYGIEVTDRAAVDTYKANGVKKVQWIHTDGCSCEECRERHLKVYPIDKIPTKPHINCKCKVKPYEE